ncbi:MAG: amidohydrolase [Clostridia bacterium]|nr:amidohydrolase [Clostridia bacterium]
MIIDAHNHAGYYGYSAERMVRDMDEQGIDKTWLLTWECPKDEYDPEVQHLYNVFSAPIAYETCREYRDQYPDRFILGFAPDPRRPESLDRLQAAIALHGVKVCGEIKLRMMYDNPDAIRMFRYCGEKGLPVTLHFDYEFSTGHKYPRPNWWYGGGIDVLQRVLEKCPETNFLGHAPGFWAHISGDDQYDKVPYPKGPVVPGGRIPELLDRYPNLYCDISAGSGLTALSRDPAFGREFLIQYQDRIVYARDAFNNKHREYLDSLNLDAEVLRKIYSGNALKLIGEDE